MKREEVYVMPDGEGYFVRVTTSTALALIASLANQLRNGHPNGDRDERYLDGKYFTIAVVPDETEEVTP